jgi:hypothetical protein
MGSALSCGSGRNLGLHDPLIPKDGKRLAEVDFLIAEVSRHAARETMGNELGRAGPARARGAGPTTLG